MGIEIVKYDPELKAGILQLQQYLWGDDLGVNAAHFEWKYERNPYLDSQFVRVALADGKVVGMRGIWGSRWEAGNPPTSLLVPCAGDLVIAPQQRHRGLSIGLIEAPIPDLRAAGHRYVFNLSASLPTLIGSLRIGWRSAGALETASRGHARRSVTERLRIHGRRIRLAQRAADRLGLFHHPPKRSPERPFSALDRRAASSADGVVVERAPRPAAMADLVERIGHDGRLRHVRDSAYFAWRFDNPLCAYRFFFRGDDRLDGYLVLGSAGQGAMAAVNIVDWEATSSQVRAELLQAALSWGEFPRLAIWAVNVTGEALELLREAGFTVGQHPESIGRAYRAFEGRPQLLVNSLSDDDADWSIGGHALIGLDDWDLRMLYSDGY